MLEVNLALDAYKNNNKRYDIIYGIERPNPDEILAKVKAEEPPRKT